jgi:hypothetical protein
VEAPGIETTPPFAACMKPEMQALGPRIGSAL